MQDIKWLPWGKEEKGERAGIAARCPTCTTLKTLLWNHTIFQTTTENILSDL